ncbi:MAG: DNA polymerase III subunit gamma/tau [Anaerovoracaceae bacterium]
MYQVLYRAYRPETFEEVLGQKHIIRILKTQIAEGKPHHAYLFCGTRGTGKTTTARLLAKAVNCLAGENKPCGICENCKAIQKGTFIDLVEIDAASNNGVDNIRELKESVKYPPVVGKTKVYIIDEVHMLSTGAFNALLKTLEEPPEHVIFILATTEIHKIPATINSRCMRMDFRRVPEDEMIDSMKKICSDEGVSITDEAVRLVAANGDGSARDSLTILDQCISGADKEVTRDIVLDALGAVGDDAYLELTQEVACKDFAAGLLIIDKLIREGKDPKQIMMGWMAHFRNLLIIKYVNNPEDILNMSVENIQRIVNQTELFEASEINAAIMELSETIVAAKFSTQPRVLLEMILIKLTGIPKTRPIQKQTYIKPVEKKQGLNIEKQKEEIVHISNNIVESKGSSKSLVNEKIKQTDEKSEDNIQRSENIISEKNNAKNSEKRREEDTENLPQLWQGICQELIPINMTMTTLKYGATPIELTERELKVETNKINEGLIEQYRKDVEEVISNHIGRGVKITVLPLGSSATEQDEETTLEETVATAADFLGIKPEIIP